MRVAVRWVLPPQTLMALVMWVPFQQEWLQVAQWGGGNWWPLTEIQRTTSSAVKFQLHSLYIPCGSNSISPTTIAYKIHIHLIFLKKIIEKNKTKLNLGKKEFCHKGHFSNPHCGPFLFLRYTWSVCVVDLTGFIPSRSPLRAHLGKLHAGTLQWRLGAGLHYSWWGWSVITVEREARREGGCPFCNYTFKFTLKTDWRGYNHMLFEFSLS